MKKILIVLFILMFGWYWTKFSFAFGVFYGMEFVFEGECEQFLRENPTGQCDWKEPEKLRRALEFTFGTFP